MYCAALRPHGHPPAKLTIANLPIGAMILPAGNNGATAANGDGTNGFAAVAYADATFYWDAPVDDVYEFNIKAHYTVDRPAPENSLQLLLDGLPIPAVGADTNNYFNKFVTSATSADHKFQLEVPAGSHYLTVCMCTAQGGSLPESSGEGLHAERVIISRFNRGIRAEPAGDRDPFYYPASSYALVNTALGDGAVWSTGEADELNLRNSAVVTLNGSWWSVPFWLGMSSDPIGSITAQDLYGQPIGNGQNHQYVHVPSGTYVSLDNSDAHYSITDDTNHRYLWYTYASTVTGRTITGGYGSRFDHYSRNPCLSQFQPYIGQIRGKDIDDGVIAHMLRFAIAFQKTLNPGNSIQNLGWPMYGPDYWGMKAGASYIDNLHGGATVNSPYYIGPVQFGCTIGIPAATSMPGGLTVAGQMLFHCLQDYGAYLTQQSGAPYDQMSFCASQEVESMQWMVDARAAIPTLIPLCRILRNQGPATPNGGGNRRQPMRPGLTKNLPSWDIRPASGVPLSSSNLTIGSPIIGQPSPAIGTVVEGVAMLSATSLTVVAPNFNDVPVMTINPSIGTLATLPINNTNFTGIITGSCNTSYANGDGTNGTLAWGATVFTRKVTFPASGEYTFTVGGFGTVGTCRAILFMDQVAVLSDQNDFSAAWSNHSPAVDRVFKAKVLAGDHYLTFRMFDVGGGWFQLTRMIIASTGIGYPPEPSGSRDPALQPMSSNHWINLPLRSGATWSVAGNLDHDQLQATTFATINSGWWTNGIWSGAPTDPVWTWKLNGSNDSLQTPTDTGVVTYSIRAPANLAPSPGDESAVIFDGNNHRYCYSGNNNAVVNSTNHTIITTFGGIYDQYNGTEHATSQNMNGLTGTIRQWELDAGAINHKLTIGMTYADMKVPTSIASGLGYPSCETDAQAMSTYTGQVQYGALIGIPIGTAMPSGLTPGGQILWRTFQLYGGFVNIQSGSQGSVSFVIYAEYGASGANLNGMYTDLRTIIGYMRICRNNTPTTIGGVGPFVAPLAEGLIKGLPSRFGGAASTPTVTSVTPNRGTTAGSTNVTIAGTGFTGATGATFGGTSATNFVVVSDISITCTTPAKATGAVSVVVTNAAGSNPANTAYTYQGAPTLTSLVPNSISTAGGVTITLTGNDFTGATGVTFAGSSATNVSVTNNTTLTCTAPAHGAGSGLSVVVTTGYGSNGANTLFAYTSSPSVPTISSLSPTSGSTGGNRPLTINGSGFIAGSTVSIGGAAAVAVVVVNSGQITCRTQRRAVGAANVTVTNANGTSAAATYTFEMKAQGVALSPPTVANTWGFVVLAFQDEFDDTLSIFDNYTNGTVNGVGQTEGYNWYTVTFNWANTTYTNTAAYQWWNEYNINPAHSGTPFSPMAYNTVSSSVLRMVGHVEPAIDTVAHLTTAAYQSNARGYNGWGAPSLNGFYMEIRARYAGNYRNAFWFVDLLALTGADNTHYTEVDWPESGGSPSAALNANLISWNSTNHGSIETGPFSTGYFVNDSNFHIFGILYVPPARNAGNGYFRMYLDGTQVHQVSVGTNSTTDNDMKTQLNMLILMTDTNTNTGPFDIDYCRVWQQTVNG